MGKSVNLTTARPVGLTTGMSVNLTAVGLFNKQLGSLEINDVNPTILGKSIVIAKLLGKSVNLTTCKSVNLTTCKSINLTTCKSVYLTTGKSYY